MYLVDFMRRESRTEREWLGMSVCVFVLYVRSVPCLLDCWPSAVAMR